MKKQYFLNDKIIILLILFGMLFGHIPTGQAQSALNWSEPINLSNSGSSMNPSMVIDSNGVVHVVWVDQIDGYQYVKSEDGGATWTSPKTVRFPFSPKDEKQPVFIAGKNGEIYIIWQDGANALHSSFALSSTFDQPSTWIGTRKLSDSVIFFDAVVSKKNILHLGYINNAGSETQSPGVYYQQLDQSIWSDPKSLYSSKYYRALTSTDVNLSLTVSSEGDLDHVVMAWDDRSQKRVFWAKSLDEGVSWNDPLQISDPNEYAGSELPYNIKVSSIGDKIILLWQVGIPGSQCIQYSQWSLNNGADFSQPVKLLDDNISCPKQSSVIPLGNDFVVGFLNSLDDILLLAWDGAQWSKPERQTELSTFLNPSTYDTVILGCKQSQVFNKVLFVVGCDIGMSGDIWFRSRSLGSLNEWFPPPSAWTSPVVLGSTREIVSSLAVTADSKNNAYAFWVQNSLATTGVEENEPIILLSEWNNDLWSNPRKIIGGIDGIPTQLASTVDRNGKLLLSWVDGPNGDLYFSWANAEYAYLESEWFKPQQLPSPSKLNSSPDILVDDLDRIVVAYAVPVNENRGIYIVQSTDLGQTWSQPARVFDGVTAGWDAVGQPIIDLSSDGNLHILFLRSSLRENDARGLYYSKSTDGGTTWSEPSAVSEKDVEWSRIICFDKKVIHRLWQENNGNSSDMFHQFSLDGGDTWKAPIKVFSKSFEFTLPGLSESANRLLYVTQSYIEDETLIVESRKWDGARWTTQEPKHINLTAKGAGVWVESVITQQGTLSVITSIIYHESVSDLENSILSFKSALDISGLSDQPIVREISTPSLLSIPTESAMAEGKPTETSPLTNLESDPMPSKNIIGFALVGLLILLIFIFTRLGKKESQIDHHEKAS